ncbi:hypothetical protein [Amycolatopsis sp.]|jgi:hypothetical protein|uniref:hypothetical protein n=1 Tax=Amycolatopsis sp. TaxID=37632 RepID=UPI002E08E63D|nr:hypothetical protein [Amycolatopsis sp.]
MIFERLRPALIAGLCVLFLAGGNAPAFADSPSTGGDLTIAQSLGDRELTLVLRRVTGTPGPLHVDVITHAGTAPGRLTMSATPMGITGASSALPAAGVPTTQAVLDIGQTPGTYSTGLDVDRPGPWELALGDGYRVAHIPFLVPVQATSPPERAVYGGFVAAGILLLVSVLVAARARRGGWVLLPAAGLVAAIAVAVTGAVLSASLPLPPQPGSQLDPTIDNVTDPYARNGPLITDFSRPPVLLAPGGNPLTAGKPGELELNLTDGATGAPVDDLIIHDSALIHLLVVSPSGRLWHLHPIRTASGRYQQHLTLPEPGHYAVSAEMVRRGGGVQLVRVPAGLDVSGTGPVSAPVNPVVLADGATAGSADIGGTSIGVEVANPAAGRPAAVTVQVGGTADLQPWLGMAGHMIVAGPLLSDTDIGTAVGKAPVWAHAHSMGGAAGTGRVAMPPVNGDSTPDETVAAYGPDVSFTYSFPTAGRYRLWIQVERAYAVITIPVVLDVPAATEGGRR